MMLNMKIVEILDLNVVNVHLLEAKEVEQLNSSKVDLSFQAYVPMYRVEETRSK